LRQKSDHRPHCSVEIFALARQAGVGLAERARRERMRAEHEIRVLCEPAVHTYGALVLGRRPHLVEI
jgi:hypothetical protein